MAFKYREIINSKEESESIIENNNEPTEKELIMMLLKQNAQLIEQNDELVKNGLVEKDTSTL